jgi:transposase-like protein
MPTRRQWSVEEKRTILAEYEAAPWGSKGAVMRRHRVVNTHIQRWASYRDAGMLETGLRKGWRVRMTPKSENAEIRRLNAEVARLQRQVDKSRREKVVAEAAAEALGKASALLQIMLQSADSVENASGPSSPDASPPSSARE